MPEAVNRRVLRADSVVQGEEMNRRLRVLCFVEGFTDIRFIVGLSRICDLSLMVAERAFRSGGLKERVKASGIHVAVEEIPGGRLAFQARSLLRLWRRAKEFDVIVSQEMLRGSLNANLVGAARGIPVVTYMGISPLEYFRCWRERGRISAAQALAGEAVIRLLLAINGRLTSACLAMGPYLRDVARAYCPRAEIGRYYGVDTALFRPASAAERRQLRGRLNVPEDKFLIVLSSRISHEKDPETVLAAADLARRRGLDLLLLNLGGGYRDFLKLAREMGLPEGDWVQGRPAAHPMEGFCDYFRTADAVVLASLAEGAAFSTLEALACGTPVVATAVGGMAVQLRGHALLTPRRDPTAMAAALEAIAANPGDARRRALAGRDYVCREWDSVKAFRDLEDVLWTVAAAAGRAPGRHPAVEPPKALNFGSLPELLSPTPAQAERRANSLEPAKPRTKN